MFGFPYVYFCLTFRIRNPFGRLCDLGFGNEQTLLRDRGAMAKALMEKRESL
jgi:hypothetical protein